MCDYPITGFRDRKTGGLVFDRSRSIGQLMTVPCGTCRVCRMRQRIDWSVRNRLEADCHVVNCMVNLTYRPSELPPDGGLDGAELSAFVKRLRHLVRYHYGVTFRFFACGEYGAKGPGHHPHFHGLLFGFDFPDKVFQKKAKSGFSLYRSALLEQAWPFGFSDIGSLSFRSSSYVAGYVTKKVAGVDADEHYGDLSRELVRCSRMPGIGYEWFLTNRVSMYERGCILIDGREWTIPRRFDAWCREEFPEFWQSVLERRSRREGKAA